MENSIRWVTVGKYAELTGDTVAAVNARRRDGRWIDGDHCKDIDGALWINLAAVDCWVAASGAGTLRNAGAVPSPGKGGGNGSVDPAESAFIEKIVTAVAGRTKPALPLTVELWDTAGIGDYLKRSPDNVRREIICLPGFPRPVRLPVAGRAHALYKAREVVAWAERQAG